MIVGNKCDLENMRKVTSEEAKEFADSMGCELIETSAKNASNVEEAFKLMAKIMKERN